MIQKIKFIKMFETIHKIYLEMHEIKYLKKEKIMKII